MLQALQVHAEGVLYDRELSICFRNPARKLFWVKNIIPHEQEDLQLQMFCIANVRRPTLANIVVKPVENNIVFFFDNTWCFKYPLYTRLCFQWKGVFHVQYLCVCVLGCK